MKKQLHFLGQQLNKIQNSLGDLWLVPSATPKSTRQKLVVKQRNLWHGDMQDQSINTPLHLSTHLTDPFENANETTAEVQFCAYPRPSLGNEKQRVSRLADRENEESPNCNEAISSYNHMYADTLPSRKLQDEESTSLEQRADVLIKKRDLMNCSKKLTFNSHYIQIPHDHEQTVWIGPSGYGSDKTRRQKHRRHCHTIYS